MVITSVCRHLAWALTAAAVTLALPAHAADCPAASYTLTSQAAVDAFPQNCDRIRNRLTIRDSDPASPITSLAPLAGLTEIGRDLFITNTNALTNLSGLDGITRIGRHVQLRNNAALADIDALAAVTRIGGYLQIRNNAKLANIDEPWAVTAIGSYLDIRDNAALTSINGLSALTSLGNFLRIEDNAELTSLDGLAGLSSLPPKGYLRLRDNPKLASIAGLSNLSGEVRYLYVFNNDALTSLDGLEGLTTLGGDLTLQNNNGLTSIAALGNLTSIGRNLIVRNNDGLDSLAGLAGLTSIPRALVVRDNKVLNDITALGGLVAVNQNVTLRNNTKLAICDALIPLLDAIDNAAPGPGNPPIPDVRGNAVVTRNGGSTCNSIAGLLGSQKPPTLSLNIAPSTISIGATVTTSTFTYQLDNSASAARALGLDFTHTLPAGLRIATPANASTDCPDASLTALDGGLDILLADATLAANAACTVTVDVVGDVEGSYTTTTGALGFTLADGSSGSANTASANLTVEVGVVLTPALAISPAALDFGEVEVNDTSAPQTVTLSGAGTAAVTISAIDAATPPMMASGGTCAAPPFTLDVGASCTLEYTFGPDVDGSVTQTLAISSDAAGSPGAVSLTGTGKALYRDYSGMLPSGNVGSISFTTADPDCEFAADPQFLPAPDAPPPGIDPIDGVVSFVIHRCQPGTTVTVTKSYGRTLPPGTEYWKPGNPWRQVPATISGTTATFSVTDGGALDEDGVVNGVIVDPSGAAQNQAAASAPQPVPVSNRWLLALLAALMLGLAQRSRSAWH